MIIYLVGISCVGKTTIGKMMAEQMGFTFFDLDEEVEKYYQKSIERIQYECLTINEYRKKSSVVLNNIFSSIADLVIAGTPSGLKFSCLEVYKKHKTKKDIISIHILDSPENVLNRLSFYDKDSKPIVVVLSEVKRKRYLKEIISDYDYFKDSLEFADLQIDIENIHLDDIPNMVIKELKKRDRMPVAHDAQK